MTNKIIIQEARENDYNFNYILMNDDTKIEIKNKINELILLYSKRERRGINFINVNNGGKIIYDLETIENKLEEQFIFGKKYFSEKQKLIIFSDDIFAQEENILKEFEKKFAQNKISNEENEKMEGHLNNMGEESVLNIFYEILSLFNCLLDKELDSKFKKDENSFNNVIKYLELKSYEFPKLKEAEFLKLNSIIHFFEKVRNKAFIYLTSEIKEKLQNEEFKMEEEAKNEIENILKDNKIVSQEILFTAFRKYILRNVKSNGKLLFNFHEMKNMKNIWDMTIYGTEKFVEECNKLIAVDSDENNGENCVVKYCYMKIYNIQINKEKYTIFGDDDETNEKDNGDDGENVFG